MDVHRSIGAVTPEMLAEGSSSAVEALHKSLVSMRKELAKKNKVLNYRYHLTFLFKLRRDIFQEIEDMKREMGAKERQEQPKFEDLFEPTLEEEDDEMEEAIGPGGSKLKRPSLVVDSRRASAGAVVSDDFDQGRTYK